MKERFYPSHLSIYTSVVLLLFLLSSCESSSEEKKTIQNTKPNIIVFLVDDMGWQDTSVPFWTEPTEQNKTYHTPNMERLASQGMKFTQAYASAVCSPTRVSLMTGMNAARHRVTNWTLRRNASNDSKDDLLEFPQWNVNGLQPCDSIENAIQATPLAQILMENGYHTIHSGKAHFGAIGTPGADPKNLGFEVNIAGHAAGAPASYQGKDNFGNDENGLAKSDWSVPGLEKYFGQNINLTDALTQEAILAMEKAQELQKPFFLYMAHYTVHIPIQADHRYYQKYLERGMDTIEAKYASMVEGMDQSLGDIMDYLEQEKIDQNTMVLFMSDNGALSAARRGGEKHQHNQPLNSGKGSSYEGGVREPMLVFWPGVTEEASICEDYVMIEDFFPSILEMAHVKDYKTVQEVDGISFVTKLKQLPSRMKQRDLFWHFPNKWGLSGPGIGTYSAIRSGDWKLIYFYKDQSIELYNIREDIGEKVNRKEENPQKTMELAQKLGEYLRSVDAQRPHFRDSGDLVPWPDEG